MTLPRLLDRKAVAAKLGVGRSTVHAIFRAVPVVVIDDHRKPFVRESDLAAYLEANTRRVGSPRG